MNRKEQERALLERIAALKNTLQREKEKQSEKDEGDDLAFTIHQCSNDDSNIQDKHYDPRSTPFDDDDVSEDNQTTISDSLSFTRRTLSNGNADTTSFFGESLDMSLKKPKQHYGTRDALHPTLTGFNTESQLRYLSESLRDTNSFEESAKLLQTLKTMRSKHIRESFENAQNSYLKFQNKNKSKMIHTSMAPKKKDTIEEILPKRRLDDIINVIPPGIEGNPDRFPSERSILAKKKKERKKPRVTIPEPFAFDEREATRKPTISERRFNEFVLEKQAEEENLIHYQFKAKPIPSSTLEPRYKELCEMREARSEEIKSQSKKWLSKNQRPFSFQARGDMEKKEKALEEKRKLRDSQAIGSPFKANPVPAFCNESNMYKFEVENAVREKRIKDRAKKLLQESKLPRRMQLHAEAELNKTPKSKKKETELFSPKVNTRVPDFVRLQNEFQRELAERKGNQPRTDPAPFRFISKDASASHDKILKDIAQDKKVLPETRWPYMGTREKVPPTVPSFGEPDSRPRSTNAHDLRSRVAREKLARLEEEAQRKKEDAERRLFTNQQNNAKVSAHFGKGNKAKKRDADLMNANIPNPKRKRRPTSATSKSKLQPRPHKRNSSAHSKRHKYRAYQFESDFAEQVKRKVLSHVSDTLRDTGNEELIAKVLASVN